MKSMHKSATFTVVAINLSLVESTGIWLLRLFHAGFLNCGLLNYINTTIISFVCKFRKKIYRDVTFIHLKRGKKNINNMYENILCKHSKQHILSLKEEILYLWNIFYGVLLCIYEIRLTVQKLIFIDLI